MTLRTSTVVFAHVANWDVTAQGQGAQRWPSQTSLSFLLPALNAGATRLCSPSLIQLLPGHGTAGKGRHRTTSSYHRSVCTRGHGTCGYSQCAVKTCEASHFYSLKRCKAAFSGLDHAQLTFQFLKVHWVLLECTQATEVISWTCCPMGYLRSFETNVKC